jgi:hypothetical protein
MIKVTTPKDTESGISKLETVLAKFEDEFSKQEKDQDYYHLVIIGEYPRSLLNEVETTYYSAGWSNVVCNTSSENGERGGLTGLRLWR